MPPAPIDYAAILAAAQASGTAPATFLKAELPEVWFEAYLLMSSRQTNVMLCTQGSFDYMYDDYATLEGTGVVPRETETEARLVAAVGISTPNPSRRDDGRLRGWVGPTGQMFGDGWDKGHFIAHALGGAVDGLEMNVFLQRRSINRGGYREMEKYCIANRGVLCFSRPLYTGPSARPSSVELGILKSDSELWVREFDNS